MAGNFNTNVDDPEHSTDAANKKNTLTQKQLMEVFGHDYGPNNKFKFATRRKWCCWKKYVA